MRDLALGELGDLVAVLIHDIALAVHFEALCGMLVGFLLLFLEALGSTDFVAVLVVDVSVFVDFLAVELVGLALLMVCQLP